MALALVVLALGSVLAGYVGVPHALGGNNALSTWLAPSFAPPDAVAGELGVEAEAHLAAEEVQLELTLMAVSSAIAIGGIALAVFVWLRRRELADAAAQRFRAIYGLLLNKYYVDELYDAALVEPVRLTAKEGLWRGIDQGLVDAAVNGTAALVASGSGALRRLQTGSVRAYAGSMFIGVIVILGYYLWR